MTDTYEQREKVIPYNNHNSNPIRSQEEYDYEEKCLGLGDPDFYGYPGSEDDPNYERVNTAPLYDESDTN